jgi:hypothetical protein
MRLFFHKLTHWEYWPYTIVYIPIYFLWAYYAFRSRTIFFFNACNPTIRNGGFMSESKTEIYDLIPQQYYPKTILVTEGTKIKTVEEMIPAAGITYPLIAKPDIGLRGSAVRKIESADELARYHSGANFNYIVQNVIPFKNESGIFYVRHPQEKTGRITGIVAKEFMIVTGDGKSTIEQLVRKNPRYELQMQSLKREHGDKLCNILEKGEKRNLAPYGNHARGSKFVDASHLISEKLSETINGICLQVPGFYFGRVDVMYNSFDELEEGINFLLVEINGAGSEPTHIYDPKHSIFFAWKELSRHIRYMYEISVANHKNGVPYLTHKEGMTQYRIHLEQSRKIVHF